MNSVRVASKDSRNRILIFAFFSRIPPARETFRSSELVVGSSPGSGPPNPVSFAQLRDASQMAIHAKLSSKVLRFFLRTAAYQFTMDESAESLLQSLRNPKAPPFEAIKAATVDRERVAPLLIQELQKFAADFQGYDRNDCLPVMAIYLLAEWQVDISPQAIPKVGRCALDSTCRHSDRIELGRVNG